MIILSKRVMAPANILSNVMDANEAELVLLRKVVEFFKLACKPTVGYKQLMSMCCDLDIVVDSTYVKEVVPTKPVKAKPMSLLEKMKATISTPTISPEQFEADRIGVTLEEYIEHRNMVNSSLPNSIVPETKEEPTLISTQAFIDEVIKGISLKSTRRLEEVETVLKAVWREYKDMVEDKEACKQFCVDVRRSFIFIKAELPSRYNFMYTNYFLQSSEIKQAKDLALRVLDLV